MGSLSRYHIHLVIMALLLAAAGLVWIHLSDSPLSQAQAIDCPDIARGCSSGDVHVRFSATPETMKPFMFSVEVPEAVAVQAGFAMKGMDMGLNRYRLSKKSDRLWQAEIVLPACMQGRGDWQLELKVETLSGVRHYQAGFTSSQKMP